MIEELHRLLDSYAHLRDLPQYKNLRQHVIDRIQKLEDNLAKQNERTEPRAIPAQEPESPEPVERRV